MNRLLEFLPHEGNWQGLLDQQFTGFTQQQFIKGLIHPLQDFFQTPGKNFRSQLVELGLCLGQNDIEENLTPELKNKLAIAGNIVECIHAGSLIVDDIQDNSQVRRSAPTLHLTHGIPLALNTGNWLYFWALLKIKDLELDSDNSLGLMNDVLNFMGQAHLGQALDLGTKIDDVPRLEIPEIAKASMQLKTGTLLSLALRLGMALSGKKSQPEEIQNLGNELGLILQMFDDFSSLATSKSDQPSKRHEDLLLRRPSWVWSEASQLGEIPFNKFKTAINELPDETQLNRWLEQEKFMEHLWQKAEMITHAIRQRWILTWKESHPHFLKLLLNLCQQLENSYVKKH